MKSATYETAMREGIFASLPIELAPDTDSVRVLVVDENSGDIGSFTFPRSTLKNK